MAWIWDALQKNNEAYLQHVIIVFLLWNYFSLDFKVLGPSFSRCFAKEGSFEFLKQQFNTFGCQQKQNIAQPCINTESYQDHEACGVFQSSLTQNTQRSPSGSWNCITLITAREPETESRSGDGTPSHVQGSVHCRDSKQYAISPLPSRKLLDCSSGLCALHIACGCHFSKKQKGSPVSCVCA